MINDLLKLPRSVIFAIINDSSKKAYISYTSNLQRRLGVISSEILDGISSIGNVTEKIEAKILETTNDKVLVKYFIADYRNKGYTILTEKIPLEYKFKTFLSIDEGNVKVVAVNKRNDKIILGTFKNIETANNFVKFIETNNLTKNLIYSIYG